MKLRELKKWTFIVMWEHKHVIEFLRKDWSGKIIIMWHANQDVKEYWDVLQSNIEKWID